MIEEMLHTFKTYLPAEIKEFTWKRDMLVISGQDWSFRLKGTWRMSAYGRVVFGCYDNLKDFSYLKGLRIIDVGIQTNRLRLDPVFFLSTDHMLEIFTIGVNEPWMLSLDSKGTYVSSPANPLLVHKVDS